VRLAIVSDIHGNLEALQAVLEDLERRRPDAVICLGDFVGYGASPNECIDALRPRIEGAVLGNHDAAAIGKLSLGDFNSDAATAAQWTEQALGPANRAYLEALPLVLTWRDALLVHAAPSEPAEWNYVLSPTDAAEEMRAFDGPLCFIGHSHYPGNFESVDGKVGYSRSEEVRLRPSARYIINVPSIGQPRDGDPRAGYAIYDHDARAVQHVRVGYDVESAMARIRAAGLPSFLAERLRWGE
jgi:diadenosine tetraphosphatase ApaH/serine/threonine PP2A family protein phosphatase